MILGISGSGRVNGITSKVIKKILENCNEETEFISLSGKKIGGCLGCTACAKDNLCIIQDDFNEIADKMLKADKIIFGAPNYFGSLNAISHSFWERTYSFRHNEFLGLAGKLGVIISIGYTEVGTTSVNEELKKFMSKYNFMSIIKEMFIEGYSQCYTCGFGLTCSLGNVIKDHGFIPKIEPHHLPKPLEKQNQALFEIKKTTILLNNIKNS